MSSGYSRCMALSLAAGLTLAVGGAVFAQTRSDSGAPKRGRAIQFSEPRTGVVSSNVNELGANKTKLQNLEQDLRKPFEIFDPADNPAHRVAAPPVRQPAPSAARIRQMRDLLEKRNEWIFLAPEDYTAPGLTAEEMLDVPEYGPDGEEKRRKKPIERYYERLEKARTEARFAVTNQSRGETVAELLQAGEQEEKLKDLNLAGQPGAFTPGLTDMEQTLKRLVPADTAGFGPGDAEATRSRSFSEAFGFWKSGPVEPNAEASRAMEARMQEFKQLLETRATTTPGTSPGVFDPLGGSPPGLPLNVTPAIADGFSGLGARSGSSPLAAPNPGLSSPMSSLPTPAVNPVLPGLQPPPPAPEPSGMKLPPPAFNIPQRKF